MHTCLRSFNCLVDLVLYNKAFLDGLSFVEILHNSDTAFSFFKWKTLTLTSAILTRCYTARLYLRHSNAVVILIKFRLIIPSLIFFTHKIIDSTKLNDVVLQANWWFKIKHKGKLA